MSVPLVNIVKKSHRRLAELSSSRCTENPVTAGPWVVNRAEPRAAENQRSEEIWAKSFQRLEKKVRRSERPSTTSTSGGKLVDPQLVLQSSWKLKREGFLRVCYNIQPERRDLYSFVVSRHPHSHQNMCKQIFISLLSAYNHLAVFNL